MRASLRGWLPAFLVGLAACAFYRADLAAESYNSDEGEWMTEAVEAWRLLRAGDFADPFWSQDHRLWGFASPTVSKLLIGAGMQAGGHDRLPDLHRSPSLERNDSWTPPEEVKIAGRLSSVILGGAGIGLLFGLLARSGSPVLALWAAAFLATNPVWIGAARRAMTDIHGAVGGLLVVAAAAAARDATQGRVRAVLTWACAGALAGLAVGCKFSAGGLVLGIGLVALLGGRSGRSGGIPAAAAFGIACVAVFVVTYPYLWEDPAGRFRDILVLWRKTRALHIEHRLGPFRDAFAPGAESFRVPGRMLLVPGGLAGWSLLVPLVLAVALRFRRLARDRVVLLLWGAAVPALLLGAWIPHSGTNSWVGWAGLVGAVTLTIGTQGVFAALASRSEGLLLGVGAATSLAFALAATDVPWARYYLPLAAGIAGAGAWAFLQLRGAMLRGGGSGAARCLDAALAIGVAATLLAFPSSSTARMASLGEGPIPPFVWTNRVAALLLAVAITWAAARSRNPAAR